MKCGVSSAQLNAGIEFEIAIEVLTNDNNSTFWEPIGTKKTLFLNEVGYQRCKADKSVKIIAMGSISH